MADSLNELYLKYAKGIEPVLEEDRYFQYLYETIESGENVLDQQNVIMHKIVDEEWIDYIEAHLDSLFKVAAQPRKFIKTVEELVPVDLAKKISGDSVRHLSQNTQFIAGDENGEIQPTKILNVTNEETYDLYENRFIYHLIHRLNTFIDKRTDVIFWATGDESYDYLNFTSNFEDASEEVEYQLSMKIKSKENTTNQERNDMDVFMRIDRLRRQVKMLMRGSFCEVMSGCAKVRSPIQRTNLLTKDHDYRSCLDLWQFLERYESIGYIIKEEKRALQFDEEYLIQFYSNYIANYAVFKTLLSPDHRDIDANTLKVKRKPYRRPKFYKTIKEEIVDSPNIEEVEIRRVFVEEVTQAQLDAEAEAEIAKRKQEEAEIKAAQAIARAEVAESTIAVAQENQRIAEEAVAGAQEAQRLAQESEAKAISDRESMRVLMDDAIAKMDVHDQARKQAEELREASEKARMIAVKAKEATEAKTEEIIKEIEAAAEKYVADIKEDAEKRISSAKAESEQTVDKIKSDSALNIEKAVAQRDVAIAKANLDAEKLVSENNEHARQEIETAKATADKIAKDALDKANEILAAADKSLSDALADQTRAEEMRLEASRVLSEANAKMDEAKKIMADAEENALKKIAKAQGLNFFQILALNRNEKKQTTENLNEENTEHNN